MQRPSDPDPFLARLEQAERHLAAGRPAQAEPLLRQVLVDRPGHPQALHLLGLVALSAGHASDAERLLAESLLGLPSAKTHVNRARALNALGRFEEAVSALRSALELEPALISARVNQAAPLQALGRLDEAVAVLESARALEPRRAETLNNLGNLYKEQGRLDEALQAYRDAWSLQPAFQEAFSNLLAASKLCSEMSPAENLDLHRQWSAWFETGGRDYRPFANAPVSSRRLKIGYLSPDCHTAVPSFIRPVWQAHDARQVELFAYFNHPQARSGPLAFPGTGRVMAGLSDAEVARLIRDDGIDILIDLAGHTGRNRLGVIAREAAPVQITWLDYLGTTGLVAMHGRLTDAVADPPGASEAFHSEQLLRLPDTQWCWEPPPGAPGIVPLPLLQNGFLTLGSFNNFSKLTARTRQIWRALLEALPDARLLVAGAPQGLARDQFLADMGNAAGRVRFAERLGEAAYRALIGEVDIALDPTPFSGATTTLDAYWQGVPVATLGGPFSWSRSTASLSAALGLDDWVFEDVASLVGRLKSVQAQPAALAHLRSHLRARVASSAITDAATFTAHLEALLRKAWQAWCDDRQAAVPSPRAAWDRAFLALARAAGSDADSGGAMSRLEQALALYPERPDCIALHADIARHALAAMPEPPAIALPKAGPASISFIICSIRPAQLEAVIRRIQERFSGHDVEVVALTDARSLAEAYNRGATRARGDILVFCHDDIDLPQADSADRLLLALDKADLVGVAGCSRLVDGHWEHAGHPWLHGQIVHRPSDGQGFLYFCAGLKADEAVGLQALDGVFLACRRAVWEQVRFDETVFDGFHLYDIDFTQRAARAGFRLGIADDLLLVHASLGRYDAAWQQYNRRFLECHPGLEALPNRQRPASLHVRLATWTQVERLHAALKPFRLGGQQGRH